MTDGSSFLFGFAQFSNISGGKSWKWCDGRSFGVFASHGKFRAHGAARTRGCPSALIWIKGHVPLIV
jgi:hypothetical protein